MSENEIRSAGSVRQKIRQVAYRHLKRELETSLNQTPDKCKHHRILKDETYNGEMGLCVCPDSNVCKICEHVDKALACPHFMYHRTKEEIKADFKEFLNTATLAEIASLYPDLAALMWVLQDEREIEMPEAEVEEPAPTKPDGPYWIENSNGVRVFFKTEAEASEYIKAWMDAFPQETTRNADEAALTVDELEPLGKSPVIMSWLDWLRWPFIKVFSK